MAKEMYGDETRKCQKDIEGIICNHGKWIYHGKWILYRFM